MKLSNAPQGTKVCPISGAAESSTIWEGGGKSDKQMPKLFVLVHNMHAFVIHNINKNHTAYMYIVKTIAIVEQNC